MKYLVLFALALATSAFAKDVYVQPYVRNDGTYVEGHHRSAPNSSRLDNYSTQGNVNPYTGQPGTVNPYQPYQPQPIQPYPGNNRGGTGICPYGQRC
jgi:hypothetical protein